jgi:hypothetical protein
LSISILVFPDLLVDPTSGTLRQLVKGAGQALRGAGRPYKMTIIIQKEPP